MSNPRAGTVTRIDTSTNAKTTFATGHVPFVAWPPTETSCGSASGRTQPTSCAPQGSPPPRESRTSRCPATRLDGNADPAMIWSLIGQQLEYATEAKLYNYPDRNGAAGATVVPEVAAAMPTVSADGRTVTIRVRSGYRFSPGPARRQHARHRRDVPLHDRAQLLPQGLSGNGYLLLPQLVGGHAYATGKHDRLTGVSASGDTLTLHLTRPVPDLPQILAAPIFSAVPQGTPHTWIFYPSSPSAGPYYLTQPIAPIQSQMILKRNPNYHGPRPHQLRRHRRRPQPPNHHRSPRSAARPRGRRLRPRSTRCSPPPATSPAATRQRNPGSHTTCASRGGRCSTSP